MNRALVVFFSLAGCATPVGGWHQSTRELCSGSSCYHLGSLDNSWQVVSPQAGEVGFFSSHVGGIITSGSACREDSESAPLSALTNRMLIGYTERVERSSELVDLDHREALHTILDVKLDGVPLTLDLFVMKRDGCIFDLSFAAPVARYPEGKADFDRFVHGFVLARRP